MRKLPKPCDENGIELVPGDVYELCIGPVRKVELKNRLKAKRDVIANAAVEYDIAAENAQLHLLERQSTVGDVTQKEMIGVYTYRLVPTKMPGRVVYNQIIDAPKNHRCPLCDLGTVTTLDHHLPKTEYPIFAVTPNNLVPSCMWCQGEKKTGYPKSVGDQTIHPYFDDFESEVWLRAVVVVGTPAVFSYFVQAPAAWDANTVQRLNSHLTAFALHRLYSENAGSELAGMRLRLRGLLDAGGKEAVREHLQAEAASWEAVTKNSWKAAMFRAASESDWFCEGGFLPE